MEEELKNLEYTLDKFDEVIDDSKLKLSNLKSLYPNNYEAMLEEKYRLEGEISSIEKVTNAEKEMVEMNGEISVLNTSLFFTLDYFGNKNNFYDQVCKLNPSLH